MIIIETCPKCGHDLMDEMICTNPPIPKKKCTNPKCGWFWEGQREQIVRVPFNERSIPVITEFNKPLQPSDDRYESTCGSCSNNPRNGGSGICHCTLGLQAITW